MIILRRCGLLLMMLSAALWATALQSPAGEELSPKATPSASAQNLPTFAQRYPRYRLRPGDSFDLSFDYTPEFNQQVTVQPDGYISLRNAGDLHVSGMTVPEMKDAIRKAYDKLLAQPSISIVPTNFEKPYFTADGQVAHPGKYELRGDTTVVQALAIAGGFNNSAKSSQVVLFRRVNDNWVEARLLNVKKMEKQRNLAEDLHLHPGDMIFVPKNRISSIQRFLPNYGAGVNVVTPY